MIKQAAPENGQGRNGRSGMGIQVIARAADILRVLKDQNTGLSLGQIAARVDLPRSTVQRIVNALSREHLVMPASPEGRIRLGPEIIALAGSARMDLVELAHPYLQETSRQTGETVDLAVLRDGHMVFVDQVVGSHRLRAVSAVGESFPLISTANGKAALAQLDDENAALMAKREGAAGSLFQQLAQIRATGIAYDLEEHSEGICAAGSALRDEVGNIWAVSIPVPVNRFAGNKAEIADAALKLRRSLQGAIGR